MHTSYKINDDKLSILLILRSLVLKRYLTNKFATEIFKPPIDHRCQLCALKSMPIICYTLNITELCTCLYVMNVLIELIIPASGSKLYGIGIPVMPRTSYYRFLSFSFFG